MTRTEYALIRASEQMLVATRSLERAAEVISRCPPNSHVEEINDRIWRMRIDALRLCREIVETLPEDFEDEEPITEENGQ